MIKRKTLQKCVIVADGKLVGIDNSGFLIEGDEGKEVLEFDLLLQDFKDKEVKISITESLSGSEEI